VKKEAVRPRRRLLTTREVCERLRHSRRWVETQRSRDVTFPRPVSFGLAGPNTVMFFEDELEVWLEKLPRIGGASFAARQEAAPAGARGR